MVNVPRRLRDIGLELSTTIPALAQELGRSPEISEIARSLGYSHTEVQEAMHISHAYTPVSLDALVLPGGDDRSILGVGVEETGFELLELKQSVALLLKQLSAREQRLVYLYFYMGNSQRQIAKELGISQTHVSRLLRKALARLRKAAALAEHVQAPPPRITCRASKDAGSSAARSGQRRGGRSARAWGRRVAS